MILHSASILRLLPGLCCSSLLRVLLLPRWPAAFTDPLPWNIQPGCQWFLAAIANATANSLIHAPIWRILLGHIPSNGTSEPKSIHIFNYNKEFFPDWLYLFTFLHSVCRVVSSPHTCQHLVSNFHPSNLPFWWIQMVTPGFDVCFTGYWWVGASLHMFQSFGIPLLSIAHSYPSPIFVLGFLF